MRGRYGILGVVLCLGACATSARLPARAGTELTAVELLDVTFTEMALVAHVTVRNTTARPRTIDGYSWKLTVQEDAVLEGQNSRLRNVLAGDVNRLRIPIAFHFADIWARAPALRGRDVVPYRLQLQLGDRGGPLEYEGMLDIPQAPTVHLAAVQVRQLGWHEATVQLEVALEPNSPATLELRGLRCALALDGRPILRARADAIAVPLTGPTQVPLTAHVALGPTGQTTAAILKRQDVSYHLTGHATLHTPAHGVLRLPIDEAGVIALASPGA